MSIMVNLCIFYQMLWKIHTVITILLICLYSTQSYVTTSILSDSILETGRIVLNTLPTPSYTCIINHKIPFKQKPHLSVTLAKLVCCSSSNIESIKLITSKNVGKTSSSFHLQYKTNDDIISLQLNYIAINFNYVPYFHFERATLGFWQDVTEPEVLIVANDFNVSDPNVHISCFINYLSQYSVSIFPYKNNIQCLRFSDTKIKVKVKNYMPPYPDVTWHNQSGYYLSKSIIVEIMIIDKQNSISTISSTLSATSSASSPVLSHSTNLDIDSYFFIGLRSFILPTRCFNLALSDDNAQIQTGDFNKLDFDYFAVTKNTAGISNSFLDYIGTHVFSAKIKICFSKIMNLTQVKFNQFSINSTIIILNKIESIPILGTLCILADHLHPVSNQDFEIVFEFYHATRICERIATFRMIVINQILYDTIQSSLKITFLNMRGGTQSKFILPPTLTWLDGVQQGQDYVADFSFSSGAIMSSNNIIYSDLEAGGFGDHTYMVFYLPPVTIIQTSIITRNLLVTIQSMPSGIPATSTQFSENSDYIQNMLVTPGSSLKISIDYIKSVGAADNCLIINYKWSPISTFCMKFAIRLASLVSVKSFNNTHTFELTFINLKDSSIVSASQFTMDSRVTPTNIRQQNGKVVVTVDCDQSLKDDVYEIKVSFPNTNLIALITDVKTINRLIKISAVRFSNALDIYLLNPKKVTNSSLPQIRLNNHLLTIKSIGVEADDSIKISTTYNKSVDQSQLEVHFEFDQQILFSQTSSFPLIYEFPLQYCVKTRQNLSNIYKVFASVLQYGYILFFLYAVICSNKLLALETIFIIQLAYYSMIPIGFNCTNIEITSLKYITGVNPFFSHLQQNSIPQVFKDMGLKSNFLSNVNLMLAFLPICPLLYVILMFFAKRSQCYRTKPRLIRCAKMFVCQVPLTVLLFSSFNIYLSLVIDIQFLGKQDIFSLAVAVVVSFLLPANIIIYWRFRSHFGQFSDKFNNIQRIGSISKQISLIIREVYPIWLVFEFLLVPLFLAIISLSAYSLYISLGISVLGLVYIMVATPYVHKLDNIRLIVHRVLALSICVTFVIFKRMSNNNYDESYHQEFIFYMPFVVLSIVSMGILVNGFQIIRLSICWFKKRGKIDHKMKVEQQGTQIRPPQPVQKYNCTKWYPKLQFSRFKRNPNRLQMGLQNQQNNNNQNEHLQRGNENNNICQVQQNLLQDQNKR